MTGIDFVPDKKDHFPGSFKKLDAKTPEPSLGSGWDLFNIHSSVLASQLSQHRSEVVRVTG